MYIEQAVERLNNIKWHLVGTKANKEQAYLGYEYLRRLANFCKEESIEATRPFIMNIAKLLGDEEDIDLLNYLNKEVIKYIDDCKTKERVIEYYVQLFRYADKNNTAKQYLNVYEPLIRLLEVGGMYILNVNELQIVNVSNYPLRNWYVNFSMAAPSNIDDLEVLTNKNNTKHETECS